MAVLLEENNGSCKTESVGLALSLRKVVTLKLRLGQRFILFSVLKKGPKADSIFFVKFRCDLLQVFDCR